MKTNTEPYRPAHNGLKSQTVNLRTSEDENEILKRAAEKLSQATGEKPNISKTIIEAVQQYKAPYFFDRLNFRFICELHKLVLKYYQAIATDYLTLGFGNFTLKDFQNIESGNFKDIEDGFLRAIDENLKKTKIDNEFILQNLRSGTETPFLEFREKTLKNLDSIDFSKKHGPSYQVSIQNFTLENNGVVTFTDSDRDRIRKVYCEINLDSEAKINFARLAETTFANLQELKSILTRNGIEILLGRGELFDQAPDDYELIYNKHILQYIKK